MKTISRGVRIPLNLFELVKAAEPFKNFSQIVIGALEEKYSFVDVDSEDSVNFSVDTVHHNDIDDVVDRMFRGVH